MKRGRPRTYNDYQVITTIPKDVMDALDDKAAQDGTSVFIALRNVLKEWVHGR